MRSFPDLKVAVLSDGSSNLEQNGRFAAEAKAHAANPAKLGLPLPEFAEASRKSSSSAGLRQGKRHTSKCYSIVAIAESGVPQA